MWYMCITITKHSYFTYVMMQYIYINIVNHMQSYDDCLLCSKLTGTTH